MKLKAEIESLAACKLEEAQSLFDSGHYDAAYYLGGYAVELLLKARVCKLVGRDDFYDEGWMKSNIKYPQTFRTHDLGVLLILSGLGNFLANENRTVPKYVKKSWILVSNWNADSRYLTGKTRADVEKFLLSIKNITTWIRKHL